MQRNKIITLVILLVCLSFAYDSLAQEKIKKQITGIVVDRDTGEPLPLSNIYIKGTMIGVVSDFDGKFTINLPIRTDSLWFNVMGYHTISLPLNELRADTNYIDMVSQTYAISEILISPDDAPRRLMRKVIANKKRNDPTQYERTSFEKYSRWEYALNNISNKAQGNWILKNAQDLMRIDADSNRYLPVYFSETISLNETQKNPRKLKSTILGDNTKGIDIFKQYEIGGFSSAMDTEVSFYENVVKLFGLGFVSPIADNAFHYYKYYITDSCYMADSTKIYTVKFRPKSQGDKSFIGTMDIETKHHSIMRIDASMPKYTNINFVKKFTINSTYQFINDSLPFFGTNEMEMHVDYMPVNSDKKRLEIKCNMYNSQRNVKLNQEDPLFLSAKALAYETIKAPNYKEQDENFWQDMRHAELSEENIDSNNAIDSLNNVGSVKTFNLMAKLAMTGFLDLGHFEIGPYAEMFNTNKIEGLHLGFGLRTSKEISKKWMFMGVIGYGFKNTRPTYQGGIGYKFDTPFRRALEITYYDRIVKIGENENILYLYENMLTTSETNVVAQIFKREEIDELMYERKLKLKYDHEWITGISSSLSATAQWQYSPKYYPFSQNGTPVERVMRQEVAIDTRFSFNEKYIDDGMQRVYMSTDFPIIHFTIAAGNTRVADVERQYARIHSTLKHKVYIGQTEFNYALEGGMYFGTLPYSMLEIPRGNKTFGFYTYDFNMMNYLEFCNDKYIYAYVDYFLNGKLFHKIPYLYRSGLREVIGFKAMLGSLSDRHLAMLDMPDKVSGVNGGYIEFNIGVDNILRFFRVDALYRLTQKDFVNAPTWGLRAQFNFKL